MFTTFHQATTNDFDSLVALRIAAMRESLERVGRFDPERARERLRKTFYPDHTQFIVLEGERIGFYTFRPLVDGFHLDHLYIHLQSQSRGVGSFVMQHLIAQAEEKQMPIHVGALRSRAKGPASYQRGATPHEMVVPKMKRCKRASCFQPQRGCVTKPNVGPRAGLRWVT